MNRAWGVAQGSADDPVRTPTTPQRILIFRTNTGDWEERDRDLGN